jgi:phage head maturation protease
MVVDQTQRLTVVEETELLEDRLVTFPRLEGTHIENEDVLARGRCGIRVGHGPTSR